METASEVLRAERHTEIGRLLQRDAGLLIQRWCERAAQEQDSKASTPTPTPTPYRQLCIDADPGACMNYAKELEKECGKAVTFSTPSAMSATVRASSLRDVCVSGASTMACAVAAAPR